MKPPIHQNEMSGTASWSKSTKSTTALPNVRIARVLSILLVACFSCVVIQGCDTSMMPPANDNNTLNENADVTTNENTGRPVANDNAVGGTGNENDNADIGAGGNENSNSNAGTACTAEADCMLGFNCVNRRCVETSEPDIEVGDEDPFRRIGEGGVMIIRRGFQGGNHIFMSVRGTGFPAGATVSFVRSVIPVDSNLPVVIENGAGASQFFVDQGDGINLLNQIFVFIDGVLPSDYDGKEAVVTIAVTDQNDPSITASMTQHVILAAEE